MTVIDIAARPNARPATLSAASARAAFLLAVTVAALVGAMATSDETARAAVSAAGSDLTHLLRFMAALKGAMAATAAAAVWWRLGSASSPFRALAYAGIAAVMVAGPGLMWAMAHVGLGALMLHGGLVAIVLLLWFDPATADRLHQALQRRPRSRSGSRVGFSMRSRAGRLHP